MSLGTWKKEFLTIEDARNVPNNDKARLERDLQKWKGLRKENLDKHNVEQDHEFIRDENDNVFEITGETCSLCQAYDAPFNDMEKCKGCPLYKVRNLRCDKGEPKNNPYFDFLMYGDPKNMIRLIEKALKNENTGN